MSYASLLFAPTGAVAGAASVLDVGGTLSEFNSCLSAEQADRLAIQSDWASVGQLMWEAFESVGREQPGVSVGQSQEATAEGSK